MNFIMKSVRPIGRSILSFSSGYYLAVMLIILFFDALFIFVHFTNWNIGWGAVGVNAPGFNGGFGDFRYILQKATCLKGNELPYAQVQSCQQIPWNYPWLWIPLVDGLGFTLADANIIGVLLAGAFFIFALSLLKKSSAVEGLCVGLALMSPPVMLAIERANIDLIMFMMIVTACHIGTSQKDSGRTFLSSFLILAAAFLKLYPIFALIPLWLESTLKKQRVVLILCAALFGFYCLWTYNDIMNGMAQTPKMTFVSYGVNVLPEILFENTPYKNTVLSHRGFIQIFLGTVIFSCGYFISRYLYERIARAQGDVTPESAFKMRCFRAGSAIFMGSYFLLGNNWHYRLIFLILCFPQAFAWSRMQDKIQRRQGIGFIVLLVLTFWLSYLSSQMYFTDRVMVLGFALVCFNHVINLALSLAFACRLFVDLRDWIQMLVRPKEDRSPS